MPYKTKFRRIETPQNAGELRAIGTDANSARSLGAACYRELYFSRASPGARRKLVDMFLQCSPIVEKYLQEIHAESQILREKKYLRYFMQGIQRAAEAASDNVTIEYVSSKLEELK